MRGGRRVADLVRGEHFLDGRRGGASSRACTSASTSPSPTASPRLRWQTTPTAWSISSSFVTPSGPQMQRRDADGDRSPAARRGPSAARLPRARPARRATHSRRDLRPELRSSGPRPRRRAVRDRLFGQPAALSLVDAEIGERQQVRTGAEHELREVRRARRRAPCRAPRVPPARCRPRVRAAGPCR